MIKVIFLAASVWFGPEIHHPSDSLRLETINGKMFIIHQVDEQETLYAISRRYDVPIPQILEFNKEADGGLDVGQILRIPYNPNAKPRVQNVSTTEFHTVAAGETLFSISRQYNLSVDELKAMNSMTQNAISVGQQLRIRKDGNETVVVNKPVQGKSVVGYHSVAPKETLFSISRDYGVTVQQLKEWNNMVGSNLEIGQLLRVAAPSQVEPLTGTADSAKQNTVPTPKEDTPKETVVKISENVAGSDEVKESGLAELIDGTEGNRKYLALHRTAKTGTILKVKNELNNREVFVRVVGPLPATNVNNNIIIKISKSAFDRLGGVDTRFRVEVTYYK